jgi:hypothetical protein
VGDRTSEISLAKARNSFTGDAARIRRLNDLVDELFEEVVEAEEYLFALTRRDTLRFHLYSAVVSVTETAELDIADLKKRVIAVFLAPLSRKAGQLPRP